MEIWHQPDRHGSNINKNRKHVALCHERVANARNDLKHKLSHTLVDENQAIIIEDWAVKNMIKNRKLSKAISDQVEFHDRKTEVQSGTQTNTITQQTSLLLLRERQASGKNMTFLSFQ